MTDSKHPTFDALMDRAYARWKDDKSWSMAQFWAQLDAAERPAVFLGNMNYQVENGGWLQWGPHGNEYGTQEVVRDILTYLTQVGTPAALKALELVEQAWDIMNTEEPDEDEWDMMVDSLHPLCNAYYDINSQLLEDIEAWLVRTFKV